MHYEFVGLTFGGAYFRNFTVASVAQTVDNFFFEWITQTIRTDNNFFKRIAQAIRMDDIFFEQIARKAVQMDDKFFFTEFFSPEMFKLNGYQIHSYTANCKERFCVRGHAKGLTK